MSEHNKRHEEERRELQEAGWEPRGRGPKTLWRNPDDDRWYAQYRAIILLRRKRRGIEEEPKRPPGGRKDGEAGHVGVEGGHLPGGGGAA